MEQTRKETTETAIHQVKAKLKEQMEAEAAAREEGKKENMSVIALMGKWCLEKMYILQMIVTAFLCVSHYSLP